MLRLLNSVFDYQIRVIIYIVLHEMYVIKATAIDSCVSRSFYNNNNYFFGVHVVGIGCRFRFIGG